MIEKANCDGDCIVNTGKGIFRPIPSDPIDTKMYHEYVNKDLSRARSTLKKRKIMSQTFKSWKDACVCGFLDAGAIGTAEPDEWFNFVLWIENGCEMLEEKPAEWGNISIINIPDDKLKFLMEMKKIFALSISTGILLKEVNSLPFIVVRGIHIGKAKKLINQTTFPDCYKFSGE